MNRFDQSTRIKSILHTLAPLNSTNQCTVNELPQLNKYAGKGSADQSALGQCASSASLQGNT